MRSAEQINLIIRMHFAGVVSAKRTPTPKINNGRAHLAPNCLHQNFCGTKPMIIIMINNYLLFYIMFIWPPSFFLSSIACPGKNR